MAAQKRSGRPRKSWDEVLENDRKKLGMDSADPKNRSEMMMMMMMISSLGWI